MKSSNEVRERSYAFSIRIIRLARELSRDRVGYVLFRQLLRSGTSIGANVEEAIGGQSRKDFLSKLRIARKEARESLYWLRLLGDSEILRKERLVDIADECEQIIRILTAIILSTESKRN